MLSSPLNAPRCLSKLRAALDGTPLDECRVIYIMAYVRKVLELEKEHRPGCLFLYASWPLHAELTKASTRKIMVALDERPDVGDFRQQDPQSRLNQLISFEAFRRDLRLFLVDYSMPTDTVNDDRLWQDFLVFYCELIAGCPLRYEPEAHQPPLKHIRRIEIEAFADEALEAVREGAHRPPFGVAWRVIPKQSEPYGRCCTFPELTEEAEQYFWTGE